MKDNSNNYAWLDAEAVKSNKNPRSSEVSQQKQFLQKILDFLDM